MSGTEELTSLRKRLEQQRAYHQSEVDRLDHALEALQTVELAISDVSGKVIDKRRFASIGPTKIVKLITESNKGKYWTVGELATEAIAGGRTFKDEKDARQAMYLAAYRLVGECLEKDEKSGEIAYRYKENQRR